MPPKPKPTFSGQFKVGKADSWSSSAWFAVKLTILFAPTTFFAVVLIPVLAWITTVTLGFLGLWVNLLLWILSSIAVLIAGLAGYIQVTPKDSNQN